MSTKTDQSTAQRPLRSTALLALIEASNNLNSIVEGIPSVRWAHGGQRLKDRKEWCEFYCALSAVNDETARNAMMNRPRELEPHEDPCNKSGIGEG